MINSFAGSNSAGERIISLFKLLFKEFFVLIEPTDIVPNIVNTNIRITVMDANMFLFIL